MPVSLSQVSRSPRSRIKRERGERHAKGKDAGSPIALSVTLANARVQSRFFSRTKRKGHWNEPFDRLRTGEASSGNRRSGQGSCKDGSVASGRRSDSPFDRLRANPACGCSSVTVNRYAPVAQWIEHWPPEPGAAGSNPARRAITNVSPLRWVVSSAGRAADS